MKIHLVNAALESTSTIDPEEKANFERLAELWWDPTGPFWPLHRLNALRVGWIIEQLRARGIASDHREKPLAGVDILDIGCGGGILSESMARRGARVLGIDVVARNLEIARQHAAVGGLDICYREAEVGMLENEARRFDVVLNMEVIEHVMNRDRFLAQSCGLVRRGGVQFVSTINRNPLAWLLAIVGAEYVLGWLPRGTHQYHKLVRPAEIERVFEDQGFEITARSGVRVNPFRKSLHLTANEWVNYMMMATA